jgi:uncharacterized membrane protein
LEAFSDGVLAIAITLLILEVHVLPHDGESLRAALVRTAPSLVAYAASFLQIGIMWANHHTLFRVVAKVDQLLLLTNLMLLAFISFLPLPTSLVAEYRDGADGAVAIVLYGGTLTGCAAAFNLLWLHVSRRRLLIAGIDAAFRRDVTKRYLLGLAGYALSILVGLIHPWITLLMNAALALLFILGPSHRQVTRPPPETA